MNLTSPADTLVCDTAQIALWQSEPAYNYNRELITPEMNVFEWISRQFGELLRKIFGSHFAEEYSGLILVCIAILLLLLIVWFVYRKRPELLATTSRNAIRLIHNNGPIFSPPHKVKLPSVEVFNHPPLWLVV